jgi:hypothetical protein
MAEFYAIACLIGILVSGGYGMWSLVHDIRVNQRIRRRLRR